MPPTSFRPAVLHLSAARPYHLTVSWTSPSALSIPHLASQYWAATMLLCSKRQAPMKAMPEAAAASSRAATSSSSGAHPEPSSPPLSANGKPPRMPLLPPRVPLRWPATSGHLQPRRHRQNLRPSSPPLHDLQAGTLPHSSILLESLIVIMNHYHSWCLLGSRVLCCQVITLQGLNWLESPWYPQIWVTLARCSHSVVILLL
jgi:hypothetical protein